MSVVDFRRHVRRQLFDEREKLNDPSMHLRGMCECVQNVRVMSYWDSARRPLDESTMWFDLNSKKGHSLRMFRLQPILVLWVRFSELNQSNDRSDTSLTMLLFHLWRRWWTICAAINLGKFHVNCVYASSRFTVESIRSFRCSSFSVISRARVFRRPQPIRIEDYLNFTHSHTTWLDSDYFETDEAHTTA